MKIVSIENNDSSFQVLLCSTENIIFYVIKVYLANFLVIVLPMLDFKLQVNSSKKYSSQFTITRSDLDSVNQMSCNILETHSGQNLEDLQVHNGYLLCLNDVV